MYSQYIKDWFEVVPKNQVKVVRMEDYGSHRLETLKDIINFLDIGKLCICKYTL